ncbi:DNase I-like protein [Daedaleopsis nitida]|nr:DNase I-like protein [Daedaleopsis nitida]
MVQRTLFKGVVLAALQQLACAVSITDIQGASFMTPLRGQTVQNLTGIVTAKSTDSGFWIQSAPSKDPRVSNGLQVYSTAKTVLAQVNVGDEVSLSGTVSEFRSTSNTDYLYVTELQAPADISVLSSNNAVAPLVLGKRGKHPPTQKLSALDAGRDGWLAVPNNVSMVEAVNATLRPDQYGLDFWASLEGQLVTVTTPTVLDFENSYGEFWVAGDWPVTGRNSRGGLTITFGPDGVPDANPEAIMVGSPLDGTKSPKVSLGKQLADITGIVVYQFGFFYVRPLTAPTVVSTPSSVIPPANIKPDPKSKCVVTIGDYNVENMAPTSSHLPTVANHIANFLNTPDIMFVQEIQDNSGATNNGVVVANQTLANLVAAIATAGNASAPYAFLEIVPEDGKDGGQPGGNIRTAYLYNSTKFSLVPGSPAGGALDATQPKVGADGKLTLTFNPGRIDPANAAWTDSRKPLVAAWETPSGARLFTINLHLTSKGGSSTSQGDARPPINGGVDQRMSQVETVAQFVKSLLKKDPFANVVVAGDCNEYAQTRAVFAPLDGLLLELDGLSGVPPVERYTYLYDQNSQQLDHMFVSPALALRGTKIEHVHVNNWAASYSARASDHDPSVAQVRMCLF